MGGFSQTFDFQSVRGPSTGVSYGRITQLPFPGTMLNSATWDHMGRATVKPHNFIRIGGAY